MAMVTKVCYIDCLSSGICKSYVPGNILDSPRSHESPQLSGVRSFPVNSDDLGSPTDRPDNLRHANTNRL